MDVAKARSLTFSSQTYTVHERDVILYALGVCAKRHELQFVYENHASFSALPTFGVIPGFHCMFQNVSFSDFIPNFQPVCF